MVNKYKKLSINGRKIDEHRYIIEQHLDRKLDRNELVHHIDGNKRNNELYNLELIPIREHVKKHIAQGDLFTITSEISKEFAKKRREAITDGNNFICTKCGISKTPTEFHKHKRHWNGIECECKICKLKRCKDYRERKKLENASVV